MNDSEAMKEHIQLYYHHVKFGGLSDNEDIAVSVCYVISQGHVIKGSCEFIGRSL